MLKPLDKSVLITLGLAAAASAADTAIHKKMFGSDMTTQTISNEEMNDNMKKGKSLEESAVLIKGISQQLKRSKRTKRRIS